MAASQWNAGAWHWEERNWTSWAKERIKELLGDHTLQEYPHGGFLKTGMVFVDGEAYVNIRKGKKRVGFELDIKVNFDGEVSEPKPDGETEDPEELVKTKASGQYLLPEVCDDCSDGDFPVQVDFKNYERDDRTSDGAARVEKLRVDTDVGKVWLQAQLSRFVKELGEK